jgi:hypothetical protein
MPESKHTPGPTDKALRAGKRIYHCGEWQDRHWEEFAEMIDAETGLPELLAENERLRAELSDVKSDRESLVRTITCADSGRECAGTDPDNEGKLLSRCMSCQIEKLNEQLATTESDAKRYLKANVKLEGQLAELRQALAASENRNMEASEAREATMGTAQFIFAELRETQEKLAELREALTGTLRYAVGFACEARDLPWPEPGEFPEHCEEWPWVKKARAALARTDTDTPKEG